MLRNGAVFCLSVCLLFLVSSGGHSGDIPRPDDERNIIAHFELQKSHYFFEVDDETLAKGSVWDGEDTMRCGPKKAQTVSTDWIAKNLDLIDTKDFRWRCVSMQLVTDHNVWCWVIDYEYRVRGGFSTGVPPRVSIPVLGDGIVPRARREV